MPLLLLLLLINAIVDLMIICPLDAIHRELSAAELLRTFGVERADHVPDYHMVRALRRERDPTSGRTRRLHFHAGNTSYLIDLWPNHRLISPHIVSVIREADNRTIRRMRGLPHARVATCHYHGRVRTHGDAHAAISDCGARLMGVIALHDDASTARHLVLQTVPERLRIRKMREPDMHHLVYKSQPAPVKMRRKRQQDGDPSTRSTAWSHNITETSTDTEADHEEEAEQLFCDVSTDYNMSNTVSLLPAELANYTLPSAAMLNSLFIFPQLDPITLEIGLFLDSQLFEHFRREFTAEPEQHLTDFALALINNVHVLYQQPSLSPNLDIVIVHFELWKSQPAPLATELHRNGQAQTLLDSFCRHQARINPGTDLTDPNHWDHAVLLTGYDIYHTTASVAGVAPVGRMCDELFACSLVEGLHLGRSFVLAHEMGHNMGMVHDGVQNQCGRSCCLMSAVNGAGKTTWSTCSVREFNAFLLQLDESGRGNCLRDPADHSLVTHDHLADGRLPGQRFTADQQCSYFWGRDFRVEIPNGRSFEDICRILWCGNSGSTISTAHPALEGSWCGGQRWCHRGQCEEWHAVEMGAYPTLVDGQWSDWTSAEKQCPVTQCQITGSIALISQLRTCTAPAPNNGGRACEGATVRGIVCGGQRSLCEGFTRQEFGDRLCSAILHDQLRPDRQLSGFSFLHQAQPCKIWCHVRDSELIRNKGQFPNGSPCGPGQFCVGGVCLTMACEGRAVVQAPEDCPSADLIVDAEARTGLPVVSKWSSAGKWDHWSTWSACSASCGPLGVQKRTRKCKHAVETECAAGKASEVRVCDPAPAPCPPMPAPAPAVAYTDWTDWSDCFADVCGARNGTSTRTRQCLLANGADCTEPVMEERKCRRVHCAEWLPWTEWTPCDARQCGVQGERTRHKKCSVEGGEGDEELGCAGESVQREQCTQTDCSTTTQEPAHTEDAEWGEWQPCSVSCGIGFQFRERAARAGGGKQARTCIVKDCSRVLDAPVWSEWSLWSACSRTCGQGVQQRTRRCLNALCTTNASELSRERKRCVLGPCPQWSSWTPWTPCASCSVFETRRRNRACIVRTNGGDASSASSSSETTELGADSCTGAPVEFDTCERACNEAASSNIVQHGVRTTKIEDGNDDWGPWSPCSASCLSRRGMRKRTRISCKEDACSAEDTQLEGCIHDAPCEQDDVKDTRWGEWTAWSECSVTCGVGGVQTRTRTCRARLVFLCGDGRSHEQRECDPAPPEACPQADVSTLDAPLRFPEWSAWSDWSACSCFSLTRYRRRYCGVQDPQLKGFCAGSIIDQQPCTPNANDASPCAAIAGGWSAWSDWSACSQDCGARGHRVRNRMCAAPLPSNRGAYCVGFSFDQTPCDAPRADCAASELAIDGRWSEWSQWSPCSQPCSGGAGVNGQRSRARYCSNPRPRNGGKACTGTDFELQACSDPAQCQRPCESCTNRTETGDVTNRTTTDSTNGTTIEEEGITRTTINIISRTTPDNITDTEAGNHTAIEEGKLAATETTTTEVGNFTAIEAMNRTATAVNDVEAANRTASEEGKIAAIEVRNGTATEASNITTTIETNNVTATGEASRPATEARHHKATEAGNNTATEAENILVIETAKIAASEARNITTATEAGNITATGEVNRSATETRNRTATEEMRNITAAEEWNLTVTEQLSRPATEARNNTADTESNGLNASATIVRSPHWGPWSPWSAECSALCGLAFRQRHRFCVAGTCEGVALQTALCDTPPCNDTSDRDARWGEWTQWSDANCAWDACVQRDDAPAQADVSEAEGSGEEDVDEDSQERTIQNAPLHASLTTALSTRTRTRACTAASAPGGAPCFGPASESAACPPELAVQCTHSGTVSQLMVHAWHADMAALRQLADL